MGYRLHSLLLESWENDLDPIFWALSKHMPCSWMLSDIFVFMDNKKKGRKDLPLLPILMLLLSQCRCIFVERITYGSSCAMMGNTSCNRCLCSPSSSTFITIFVCAGASYDSVVLKWERFILKVLMGWTFTKFVVIALGVEFCWLELHVEMLCSPT
jgi:hypothetical protein